MRSSLLILAASAVSAAILPRTAPALPESAFPKVHAIPFEEAKALKEAQEADPNHVNNIITIPKVKTSSKVGILATTDAVSVAATCGRDDNIRVEWRSYATTDRQAFVAAIKCLQGRPASGAFPPAKSRYEDFVRLHQLNQPNIHGNSKFLLWHRYFVWTFESVLRAECGFNRAFPWWDETLDAGRFSQSDLFTSNDYFGALSNVPNCVSNGAFANLVCNIGPSSSTTTPHCLTRAVDESLTGQVTSDYVNLCNSRGNYADMASCSEGGPHAYGHNGIGSIMSDVAASPSDPIFFMHHLFIDRNFRIWQNQSPGDRTTSINGVDKNGTPLTLDTLIFMGDIRPNISIRNLLNTLGGFDTGAGTICYRYSY